MAADIDKQIGCTGHIKKSLITEAEAFFTLLEDQRRRIAKAQAAHNATKILKIFGAGERRPVPLSIKTRPPANLFNKEHVEPELLQPENPVKSRPHCAALHRFVGNDTADEGRLH